MAAERNAPKPAEFAIHFAKITGALRSAAMHSTGTPTPMLFATLTLEREPLQWAEVPQALINWLQSAGAIAALGLFLVFAARASFSFQRLFAPSGNRASSGLVRLGTICTVASWVGFVLVGALYAGSLIGLRRLQP